MTGVRCFKSSSEFSKCLDRFMVGAAVSLVLASTLSFSYSLIEGYVDPVLTPLVITNPRLGPTEFDVTFDASAEKLRNCDWIESRWYIGERFEHGVRTRWTFAGKPMVRAKGVLIWFDQTAQMTPQELFQNSHADAVHQCPWRLFPTVTPIWDSNDDLPAPDLGEPVVGKLQQEIDMLRNELEKLR